MRVFVKKTNGFSLNELMMTLLLLSFLLLGAYRFAAKFTSSATGAVNEASDSRSKEHVERVIFRELHRIGYNPYLIEYKTTYDTPPPHPYAERIGLVRLNPYFVEFTSDDNLMMDDSSVGLAGAVQEAEIYGLWAAKTDADTPVDFSGLLLSPGEGCVPNTRTVSDASVIEGLDQLYNLYGRTKDPTDPLNLPTKPTVLAKDILCFEAAYYTRGSPDTLDGCPEEKTWERLHSGACNPDYIPPEPTKEEAYYKFLRDMVRKVDIHILQAGHEIESAVARGLVTEDQRVVKRLKIEFEIKNLPWVQRATSSLLPSSNPSVP